MVTHLPLAILALLVAAGATHASLAKRQDPVTASEAAASGPSDISDSPPSATGTSASSSTSTSSGTVPPPEANTTYAFACGEGYELTYAIEWRAFPGVALDDAVAVVSNWTGTQNASNPGAVRNNTVQGVTYVDTLVASTISSTTHSISQDWTTGPFDSSPLGVNLTVSNATQSLHVYTNTSAAANNLTTAQWFVNFCASDQSLGYILAPRLISQGLDALGAQLANSTSPSPSGSGSLSPTPTSSETGVVSTVGGSTPAPTPSPIPSSLSASIASAVSVVSAAGITNA